MSERLVDVAARLLEQAEGKPFAFAASAAVIERLKREWWDQHLSLRHPENYEPPPLEPVTHLFGVPVRQATRMPHRDDYFALLCDA
jgi:hypothetical protein